MPDLIDKSMLKKRRNEERNCPRLELKENEIKKDIIAIN